MSWCLLFLSHSFVIGLLPLHRFYAGRRVNVPLFNANNHEESNDASTPLSSLKSSQLNSNNRKRRGRPTGKSKKYDDLPKRESGRLCSISDANTNHANQHQFCSSPIDADIPSVGSPLTRKRKFPFKQKCTGVFGGDSGAALYGVGRALVENGSELIEWSKECSCR